MNIIVTYLIIIIVLFIIIWRTIHRRRVKIKNKAYSWSEILLYPFDKKPFLLYKHLSPDNKGAFWNLISNIFICIITFWAGITLQLYINDEGQQYSERLTRYQIIDKFYPDYQQCVDSCSKVYSMLQYVTDEGEKNGIEKADSILSEYLDNDSNYKEIDCAAEAAIEYYSKVLPYISSKATVDSIKTNNYKLFLGRKILSKINSIICDSTTVLVDKTISLFSKSDSVKEVNKLIRECYTLESKIGYSDSTTFICQKFYSLSKEIFLYKMFKKEKEEEKEIYKEAIIQFVLYPMVANRKIIKKELFIQKSEITWNLSWENIKLILEDIRTKALYILLFCIFVGYYLFRIIMMRMFNRDSLRPNPLLSQNDYDKLQSKIDSEERENKQKLINETALLIKIESLEDDLISKKKEMEQLQLDLRKWKDKEIEYIKELERVNKINVELNNIINKQQNEI